MKQMIAILMIGCIFLSGCARQISEEQASLDEVVEQGGSSEERVEQSGSSEESAAAKAVRLGADLSVGFVKNTFPAEEAALAQHTLALGLLKGSAAKGENLLLSTFSVSVALALAATGSEGETLNEMLALLGVSSKEEMNTQYGGWYKKAANGMNIANSVWIREGEAVKEEYLLENKRYYDAEIYQGIVPDAVNEWISEKTEGKIAEFAVDPDAELHLINALSMDLDWMKRFESEGEGSFTDYAGKECAVEMMKGAGEKYFEMENAVGFTKMYGDSSYSFAAILPEGDIYAFLEDLQPEELRAALKSAESAVVSVTMPVFKEESALELKDQLVALGMPSAFGETADFSGISEGLYIGEVAQKNFIEVTPEGTAAGAATDVSMKKYGSSPLYRTVKLNRPFIYIVLDEREDLPIFIGLAATF